MQRRSSGNQALAAAILALALISPLLARAQDPTASCNGGDDNAPCFTDVDDILGGQRYLLRTDDVIWNSWNTSAQYAYGPLLTEGLSLAPATPETISSMPWTTCPPESRSPWPFFTRLGRIYDLKNDVLVSYLPTEVDGDCSQTIVVSDPGDENKILQQFVTFVANEPRLAVFDADLDGYDDIFVMDAQFMQFYSPPDVDDPTAEMVFRYQMELPASGALTPRADPVSGDFNGDGVTDVAWLAAAAGDEVLAHFASVCPAEGVRVPGATCSQAFEIVPWTETLPTGQAWTAPAGDFFPALRLAAGDYDGVLDSKGMPDAELVLVIRENGADAEIFAYAYEFTDELKWENRIGKVALGPYYTGSKLNVASGRLDGPGSKEQVVVGASWVNDNSLWTLSLDNDGLQIEQTTHFPHIFPGIQGVAIGRFDPPDVSTTPLELDLDQQIAVLNLEQPCETISSQDLCLVMRIFSRGEMISSDVIQGDLVELAIMDLPAPLQAGDLQGRSLQLAAPEKSTVVHSQVDTVLAMPPMHADYIASPDSGETAVYNVSVFPDSFYAGYSFEQTSSSQGSAKSTTSYTYATKESFGEKISYGIPDLGSLSVSAKQAASQKHSDTVATKYDTYTSEDVHIIGQTVFDDQVSYTTNRMNVYSYPVIGQSICPTASPDCPDKCGAGISSCPKLPLHVQFSGVDYVMRNDLIQGAALEWYQPVQEPGNLFSYPASLAQLKTDQPPARFDQLAPPAGVSSSWDSQSGQTTDITWTQNGSDTKTSGTVANHSFDASVSVSGEAEIAGVGLSASASFDYNNSSSVSNLNVSTTSLDASRGVTVLSGGTDSNPPESVHYDGETYIFGVNAPDQKEELQTNLLSTSLQTEGPLRVGFVADLSTSPGGWWQTAYGGTPDIGLNHPQRWHAVDPSTVTTGDQEVHFNCPIDYAESLVPSSPGGQQNYGCTANSLVTLERPLRVALAPFYQMKGLFVRPGEAVSGPTTYSATAGDVLTLQARVYNYSFAPMPAGTLVHVEFYAQPWDNSSGQFLSAPGNSNGFAPAVYIGEDTLPPIPAFCPNPLNDDCSALNWAYAQTTWQTPAADADSHWKFWVVTWMEQGGALVEEIPGHGLQAIPAADLNSLVDVPIETYSNNLGFYNQIFSLTAPQEDDALSGQALVASEAPDLEIALAVPRQRWSRGGHRRRPDEDRSAKATLRSSVPLDDVVVRFYEGDPTHDGTRLFDIAPADLGAPFDVDIIPHIAADDPYVVAVRYRPEGCGIRWLLAEAVAVGGPVAAASATTRTWIRGDRGCRQAAALSSH